MNPNIERFNKLLLHLKNKNKIVNNKIFIEDIYELSFDDKESFIEYLTTKRYVIDYNSKLDDIYYSDDNLTYYLNEISKLETFTKEEEKYYFTLYKNNHSLELKNFIAEHNLKLVIIFAKYYKNTNIEFLDLIQAGNIGLLRAIDKFDIDKGYKFSTYAGPWILKEIRYTIAKDSRTIKLPHWVNEKLSRIMSEKKKYITLNGHEPSNLELSQLTGYKEKEIEEILCHEKTYLSLESSISNEPDEKDSAIKDIIPDTKNPLVDDMVIEKIYIKRFWELAKKTLTEKEYKVLSLRYDNDFNVIKTFENIGNELNVSKQRIINLEKDAKIKCKKKLSYYI